MADAVNLPRYRYSPLKAGWIRLLRLVPFQDSGEADAPVRCQIFHYPLLGSNKGMAHLYEALSYVWGPGGTPKSALMSGEDRDGSERDGGHLSFSVLPIGVNLDAALRHLRDHALPRFIWIDAICINQEDIDERERQVQLMAMIYASASRVVVWFGEAEPGSEDALEAIHKALEKQRKLQSVAQERNELSCNPAFPDGPDGSQESAAVLTLLRRPWFERIWVLQEVAAAQHVLVMYGAAEIDGHVFCEGLNSLRDVYAAIPSIQSLVDSAIYLVRHIAIRQKAPPSVPESFSLKMRPLGELMDAYHTRRATDRRDKVFALLGMSSDSSQAIASGLAPDYGISWAPLFQRAIRFVLGEAVKATTWDDQDVAVISGRGTVVGRVGTVHSDSPLDDRQLLSIDRPASLIKAPWIPYRPVQCVLQTMAGFVQENDIICHLAGAPETIYTIIRPCKDHFGIVAIGTGLHPAASSMKSAEGQWFLKDRCPPRDFRLIWDWKDPPEGLRPLQEYDLPMRHRQMPSENADHNCDLNTAAMMRDFAIILEDAGDDELIDKAVASLQEAINIHERELSDSGEEYTPVVLDAADFPRDFSNADALQLWEAADLFWRRGDFKQLTNEIMTRVAASFSENVMRYLLDRRGGEFQTTADVVEAAARNRAACPLLKVLLDRRGDEVHVTERAMVIATQNQRPLEVLEVLLGGRGHDAPITDKVLMSAAEGAFSERAALLEYLLDKGCGKRAITDKLIRWAVQDEACDLDTLELLLKHRYGRVWITENLLRFASDANKKRFEFVVKFLEQKGKVKIPLTEGMIELAARAFSGSSLWTSDTAGLLKRLVHEGGSEAPITTEAVKSVVRACHMASDVGVVELLLDKGGSKVPVTSEVVELGVQNANRAVEILGLLLAKRGEEVRITEDVLRAVVSSYSGEKVLELLLERRSHEVRVTEDVLKAAAGARYGSGALKLLLEKRADEIRITEDVVIAAAGRNTECLSLLLTKRGDEIRITDAVVTAAASWYGDCLGLLLTKRGDEIHITDKLVAAAAAGSSSCFHHLLEKRGDEVRITDDVAVAAASGGGICMNLLLERRSGEVRITDDVVVAAASGYSRCLESLLEKRGGEVRITDAVVKAAATNFRRPEVLEFLLRTKGDMVQTTQELIELVAESWHGEKVLWKLLAAKGRKVPITEKALVAIVGWAHGKETLEYLLQQRGNEIRITEEVVKAAASRSAEAEKYLRFLLRERGSGVQITEEVLKTAIQGNQAEDCLRLLLLQRAPEVRITEGVIRAAVLSKQPSSVDALRLLQERGVYNVRATLRTLHEKNPEDGDVLRVERDLGPMGTGR